MKDHVNEYLKKHHRVQVIPLKDGMNYFSKDLAPKMKLADGTTLSVQASETHYCSPRFHSVIEYTKVEVGYPSREIPEIMEFGEFYNDPPPTSTVYAYVPVDILNAVIEKAGGIIDDELEE